MPWSMTCWWACCRRSPGPCPDVTALWRVARGRRASAESCGPKGASRWHERRAYGPAAVASTCPAVPPALRPVVAPRPSDVEGHHWGDADCLRRSARSTSIRGIGLRFRRIGSAGTASPASTHSAVPAIWRWQAIYHSAGHEEGNRIGGVARLLRDDI